METSNWSVTPSRESFTRREKQEAMKLQDVHRGHRMPLVLAIHPLSLSLSRSLLPFLCRRLVTEDNAILLLSDQFRGCTVVIRGTMPIQLRRFTGMKT